MAPMFSLFRRLESNGKALILNGRQGFFVWLTVLAFFVSSGNLCAKAMVQDGTNDDATPEVSLVKKDGKSAVLIRGVSDVDSVVVQVWLSSADINTDPPMMGKVSKVEDGLLFVPRFPFKSNTQLNVGVQTDPKLKPDHFSVSTAEKKKALSSVEAIYPSSNELAENILKFYVQFSSPMRKGDIYDFIRIREVDGDDVELPFLQIEQELWSRDSLRLTLLLDPGRIKRGLKPREEMGAIFVAGKTYELVIDKSWPNAEGVELGKDHVKRFLATDEDRTQPDPKQWKQTVPEADSKDAFRLEFSDSLDRSMLTGSAIAVEDAKSKPVVGEIVISNEEKSWSFVPNDSWQAGHYRCVIDEDLEDIAGNSIGRPFDVDVFEQTETNVPRKIVLEFEVK